jgi:hypothetical protein
MTWFAAFASTVLVECAVVWLLRRRRADLAVALLAQLTHPLAWTAYHCLAFDPILRLVCVEAFALAAEAILYARALRMTPVAALGLSAIANGASLAAGSFF